MTVLDSLRLLQVIEYLQSDLYARALAVANFIPVADAEPDRRAALLGVA